MGFPIQGNDIHGIRKDHSGIRIEIIVSFTIPGSAQFPRQTVILKQNGQIIATRKGRHADLLASTSLAEGDGDQIRTTLCKIIRIKQSGGNGLDFRADDNPDAVTAVSRFFKYAVILIQVLQGNGMIEDLLQCPTVQKSIIADVSQSGGQGQAGKIITAFKSACFDGHNSLRNGDLGHGGFPYQLGITLCNESLTLTNDIQFARRPQSNGICVSLALSTAFVKHAIKGHIVFASGFYIHLLQPGVQKRVELNEGNACRQAIRIHRCPGKGLSLYGREGRIIGNFRDACATVERTGTNHFQSRAFGRGDRNQAMTVVKSIISNLCDGIRQRDMA